MKTNKKSTGLHTQLLLELIEQFKRESHGEMIRKGLSFKKQMEKEGVYNEK